MNNKSNNTRRIGKRTKARRRAVDILYEAETRDEDPVGIVDERRDLSQDQENRVKPVSQYTADIVSGVAVNLDGLDEAIARNLSSQWRLDRLPPVERAVLRVSAWELMYNRADVPRDVAVKEGIQLAADYSHVKASGYVNAVLDGIARDIDIRDKEQAQDTPKQD